MTKSNFFTTILISLGLFVFSANAQSTARLQVIHNAADPAAASVDIYLNGERLLDDFGFREATEYIDAPANEQINIGVAAGTSTSVNDTLKNFSVTLAEGGTYVAFANGVLDPEGFAENPDGKDIAFTLLVKDMAREMAMDAEKVEFFVLHGSTDAPTVDVIARDVATLVENAAYTDMTDYIAVGPDKYLLDVTPGEDNETIVATFEADLSGLAGGAAAVFASGFLSPAEGQPAFGIFAALPNGDVVGFEAKTTARVQIIHNAADPGAASVDIYLNDGILLDDFGFREASAYVDAPANQEISIAVAGPGSASSEEALATFDVTLKAAGTYVVFANGVLDPEGFAENPDGKDIAFTLLVKDMAREMAMDAEKVEFFVLHGSTDAPTVDVIARDVATLVENAAYTDMTDYIAVGPDKYLLDVTPGEDNETIVATFEADLSGLAGGAAAVFASGFLSPAEGQPAFGIFAALPNGDVVGFEAKTTARVQIIHNAADPGAASVDIYLNDGILLDDFGFREASAYVDAPANQEISIAVAGPGSASSEEALATFDVTLKAAGTYVVFANGVLDPEGFAENPDGKDIAFTLLVKDMAREMAMDAEKVEFFVLHGSTDAPTVDVIARDVATLVENAAYTDMTDYIAVGPDKYLLDVTPGEDNETIVATFEADLSGLAGGAAAVFASGFLSPAEGQPAFGIFAALPNGDVVAFGVVTSINVDLLDGLLVERFELSQNYPNPFNPVTTISFSIPRNEFVAIKVFNVVGQQVATLVSQDFNAGAYKIKFDAQNIGSGIYFYTIKAGDFTQTRRMTLLK